MTTTAAEPVDTGLIHRYRVVISSRPGLMAVLLLAVASLVVGIWVYGAVNRLIFVGAEWELATERRDWSVGSLTRPLDGTWSTIPILGYKLLFEWKGLLTYNHYAAMLTVAHLSAAWFVFAAVARRAGWGIGLIAAVVLLAFGSAAGVMLWPMSVGAPVAVAAGTCAWLLWDLSRPRPLTDALGAGALVVAISAGLVGVGFAVACIGTVWLRRSGSWRRVAWPVIPIGLAAGWWVGYGLLEPSLFEPWADVSGWEGRLTAGMTALAGTLVGLGSDLGALALAAVLIGGTLAVLRTAPGSRFWLLLSGTGVLQLVGALHGGAQLATDAAVLYGSAALLLLACAEMAKSAISLLAAASSRRRAGALALAAGWIALVIVAGSGSFDRARAEAEVRADDVRALMAVIQLVPVLAEAHAAEPISPELFGSLTFGSYLEARTALGSAVPTSAEWLDQALDAAKLKADRLLARLAVADFTPRLFVDPPTNVRAADWWTGGGTAAIGVTPEGCRVFHVGGDNPHVVMSVAPGDRLFMRSDGQRSIQLFVGMFAESHQPAAAQRTYLEPESWYVATAPASPDGRRWSIRVDPPVASSRLDLCVAGPAPAPPVTLVLDQVLTGFDLPVLVTHAGDGSGRLFVVERGGKIRVVSLEGGSPATFVDLSGQVSLEGEQGLLGLAFHPDFAANGRLFVNYTDLQGDTVIAELEAGTERLAAPAASQNILLRIEQPSSQHNGGMVAFGPDGYLYVGIGDGLYDQATGRSGTGQEPETLLGTILRLDVDAEGQEPYAVPSSNPLVAPEAPEVWAYGLRNPWRFSFDRATGDLWIGDVGQRDREEINVQRADSPGGENYGWAIMEGSFCYLAPSCDHSGLTLPVAEYRHGRGNCAVVGGYVYRGRDEPELVGSYLYGDFCSGRLWLLDAARPELGPTEIAEAGRLIASFGEDEDGELYVVAMFDGAVLRVRAER